MLKTVSSITNAIGALNFKGTWNASTNTPTIVSGVGVKGDYFVVSVAGSTTIDGISNWGVGDWITYNGTVWQRVEGGADLNGVNLSVSGTTTLSGLTASTALALNASKEVVSVTNTGTGDNVLATTPTLVGDVTLSTGNLVIGTAGKGIDFSADPSAPGMTSELLDDYEEGTWTPIITFGFASVGITYAFQQGSYTKVGRLVTATCFVSLSSKGSSSGDAYIEGLPFATSSTYYAVGVIRISAVTCSGPVAVNTTPATTDLLFTTTSLAGVISAMTDANFSNSSSVIMTISYIV
jgi:hypothetical protein